MSKLNPTRAGQRLMMAEFIYNFNDWCVDSVSGAKVTFGSTVASADPSGVQTGLTGAAANTVTLDAIPMPVGGVVRGGEVIVETPFAGCTAATLNVGIAGTLTAFASAVNVMAAAGTRTALTLALVQLLCNGGTNVRLTHAYTVANATAGRVRVAVQYSIDGKGDDVLGL